MIYKIKEKKNILEINFEKDKKIIEEFLNNEDFIKFIDELKERVVELFLNYDEVIIIVDNKEPYLLLLMMEEIVNKSNITLILKVNIKETEINKELINLISNIGIELLIDFDLEDKDIFLEKIKEMIEYTLNEIERNGDIDFIIHPVYEIILLNIIRKLFDEKDFDIENILSLYNEQQKEIIKNINIDIDKLNKTFYEFTNAKIIKGNN